MTGRAGGAPAGADKVRSPACRPATAVTGARNGLPEWRPYRWHGDAPQPSPAELTARVRAELETRRAAAAARKKSDESHGGPLFMSRQCLDDACARCADARCRCACHDDDAPLPLPPAPAPRCRRCGYRTDAPGHAVSCGDRQ